MIEITIHCPEMDRLATALSELAKVQKWEQQAWADAEPNTEKPKTEAPAAETVTESAATKAAPTYSITDIRDKGIKASREFGKKAIKDILDSLGVDNMSSLQPEQFGKFLEALENLKNG